MRTISFTLTTSNQIGFKLSPSRNESETRIQMDLTPNFQFEDIRSWNFRTTSTVFLLETVDDILQHGMKADGKLLWK